MAFPVPETPRRELYPEIEPFASGWMETGDGNRIYYEECGNPQGLPVVVLHGGPGGAVNPGMRRYFDPAKYRIVLFDQRGCGQSTPNASETDLSDNTTWTLIEDIERLRERCGIDKWVVFGGSWGSTLSLAYAITHPERCTALLLRGIFLLRKPELYWFYQEGASMLYADAWERFVEPIPEAERGDLIAAYHRRLFGDDPEAQLECAKAWADWERATAYLEQRPGADTDQEALNLARIENHYFTNRGFFTHESQLLDGVDLIRHIPAVIVQGRYDCVCPPTTAWDLHRAWPEAEFVLNPLAGHSMFDPQNTSALVDACDKFRP